MVWQDIVISLGTFFFGLALIPSLISKDKPAFKTSVMTAFILFVMVITYATLGLWMASAMNIIMCILWSTLAIQKLNIDKSKFKQKK